ncbi:MAG: insulinase family protein [Gemmatimonadetes bacterium]|nr:insulinase family protein [Gemmatimonadota bacterium]MBT8403901.1 insulinase family protein [Gemmatimonadota bacterium]
MIAFRIPEATGHRRVRPSWGIVPPLTLALGLVAATALPSGAQEPTGRTAVESLQFDPLRFTPPEAERYEVEGVVVFFLPDASLPLVDVLARFEGGYARFGRENYAAATALPSLLRTGGTDGLTPDSVDVLMESLALQTTFGTAGGAVTASLNTLRDALDPALDLWWAMLTRPGFDPDAVEVWRGRQLESVLRRIDDPGRLAFSEFNRLMYGDHPIGWEMDAADLRPERLDRDALRRVHGRIACREQLVLGVSGDVTWDEVRPRLERLVASLASCAAPVPEAPIPEIRREPGVFLIPRDLDQSTIVLAHTTSLRQGASDAFFASRIGNTLLGAGGFSSRLVGRVRTEEGYAYAASSLWTTPERYDGLIGATTRTRPEATVAALRVILDVFDEMREAPPTETAVRDAVDEFVNGFVFAFSSPVQIVARRISYEAAGLPEDWLGRYVEGIQRVDPEAVQAVFRRHLDPDRMTVLVVGNPEALDEPLEALGYGPVTVIDPDAGSDPGATSAPSGSPRFRR